MLDSFLDNPAAATAGIFAMVCLTSWPLFRSRRGILLAQLGAGVGFATHYALLDLAAPSLVNVLGSVQTVAALFAPRSRALNRIGYGLIPLMMAAGIYFWNGPESMLCVMAMGLIAFGRMQDNQLALRLLILSGGVFWTVHDYLVESWIALTADIGAATLGIAALFTMLFRVTIERRPAPSLAAAHS